MTLASQLEFIVNRYKALKPNLEHAATVLDIYEGNLLQYVLEDLDAQLSEKSFETAVHRVAPINLLQKIVEKTSSIYTPEPSRRIVGGTERDQAIFDWYKEHVSVNDIMTQAAEMYTMAKSCLLQPYVDEGKPGLRVVSPDRCFVISTNKVDDMKPTHVVTFDIEIRENRPVVIFTAYTNDGMLIFDDQEEIEHAAMAALNNPEGINPVGRVPFVYSSASKYRLMPTPDSDLLRMTRLLPVMMSDLNYSVMFQCFSILYGINLDDADLKMAPNAFWRLKKDLTRDGDPSIGMIKPQVDYDGVLSLIQSELSIWLNSRGIRPGSIGKLDGDQFGSGIAKIVDEMDTYEAKNKLIERFKKIEIAVWDLIMHTMHPYWVANNMIDMRDLFSPNAKLELAFPTQEPLVSRGQVVADLALEVKEGFTSRKRALQRLYPLMTEVEIDELIAEIDAERTKNAAPALEAAPDLDEVEVKDDEEQAA